MAQHLLNHPKAGRTPIAIGGQPATALTINGTVPGPLLRFREGETVILRVVNRLDELTTIHWHGVLVPSGMDGVAGVSFPGIRPGETFTYRYRVRQNGTYWYHSHQGLQEQAGHYGPLIIDPVGPDPVAYDREHVVFLSDWTFEDPNEVLDHLVKQAEYYNFQQRKLGDFFSEVAARGLGATLRERLRWGRMRMSPTDISDVTGYTYTFLLNGMVPQTNWTGLFRPGERVRLRFINGAAATFFNVRIPGLKLTVVQADGQNVAPVTVDEFQIAVAETYDVVVQPQEAQAYTVFAEAMDRSGYARGTLVPQWGMSAPVPPLRERPLHTMVDMGMAMGEMERGGQGTMAGASGGIEHRGHHDMAGHGGEMDGGHGGMEGMAPAGPVVARHGPGTHGPAKVSVATVERFRLGERPTGLEEVPHRVLVYNDLQALEPNQDPRPPDREVEIHLTGNMETFMWGFDGRKFSEIKVVLTPP